MDTDFGWEEGEMKEVYQEDKSSGWVAHRLDGGWEFIGYGQERVTVIDLSVEGGIRVGPMEFRNISGYWEVSYR
jgi:hypothetical protein